MRTLLFLLAGLMLAGCAAKTALDVATLPVRAAVRVGEAAWDATTESQDERDLKRGRELRRQEEEAARAARRAERDQQRAEREAARGEPRP